MAFSLDQMTMGDVPVTTEALNSLYNDLSPNHYSEPGTHLTNVNNFSIAIQTRWKFHLTLIQLLVIISQQNFAHATTAQL